MGLQALESSLCTSEFQAVSVKDVGRAAREVKKGLSFTCACKTYLHTLLVNENSQNTDLVGPATPHEDQELLSFIKAHSCYLKHT